MMILRSSPTSPFGRKVKLAAALTGLTDKIEVVAADTSDPADALRKQNPLGKIPVLVLEDGRTIYDSRVILEYFDLLAGGNVLIPAEPAARITTLTQAALADGILDAAILLIYEGRFRPPEHHVVKWTDYQADKVARGLAAFAVNPPQGRCDVVHIGLACVLGYLDLRFSGRWRETHKNLVAWHDGFEAEVPAFTATRVMA